ncbi:methyltransferase domain-containing protein [Nocardioides sp. HDW12B]|uniref:class I SAM-dependent methyltransferase n=1 Tax=Nocardioides sp. HDW12B TaxID=2714939 RepID=UPI001408061C|nr:methyltransferase domain-containing protein [Nocardioides sp. HDW12B]QIK65749.1 methyltransferase domain-containing protein [Nocardioides sp. HDW12B]
MRGVTIPATVVVTPPPQRPVRAFARWVAQSTPPGADVLNIGGGCNRSGALPGVRRRAGRVVSVDPSARVDLDTVADERHRMTLEQFAPDHPESFDVAFAVYVLEHVADPAAFAEAAARVLRPGGCLLALTLNRWHYFGLTTWATSRLGVDEWLLRRVRDPEVVQEYHVPTEYRMNSIGSVAHRLEDAGFSRVELRMWDLPRLYEPYLPPPLKGVATAWNRAAYTLDHPALMGHLMLRAER